MYKPYFKKIQVEQDAIDDLNHVNNVIYVQWIQDIAKEHWQEKASKELLENCIWVVKSHFIEYKKAAVLNDVIALKTFIKLSKGALSIRMVEMHDETTGELILTSKTEWVLLDSKSLRPIRVSEEIKDVFR
ncbi:acyl-CoA thioesterase [Cellulophaga baltica]|uniref:acyl-CoA thioesterase n=1 Tax=Cellulophaga TaxID=104264 RepID=UPI001C06948F|nr:MULTISPECIES: acyl-CoA thioesterase [Cellulophaga]MBU2996065.1 acyl-CoA thioesterase [Cellulophaga baltica]MDO6767460.1 acyl-CoA thioesterase [Cellulophaga sp. 1_MG-2023]